MRLIKLEIDEKLRFDSSDHPGPFITNIANDPTRERPPLSPKVHLAQAKEPSEIIEVLSRFLCHAQRGDRRDARIPDVNCKKKTTIIYMYKIDVRMNIVRYYLC